MHPLLKFCLIQGVEGASVAAAGAMLWNAAGSVIGINGIDIRLVASAAALGSLLVGLVRKYREKEPIYEFNKPASEMPNPSFSDRLVQHEMDNMITACVGYAGLMVNGGQKPALVSLLLAEAAGSVIQTAVEPLLPALRR